MTNVDEHVLHEIDDALQVDIDKEEILRKVKESFRPGKSIVGSFLHRVGSEKRRVIEWHVRTSWLVLRADNGVTKGRK